MGRLRRIFELANNKLPSYNSAFAKLRGIAHPLDAFLTGRVRFARKIGSPLPIWLPDNQTELSSPVDPTKSRIDVADVLSWVQPGSKLQLDGRAFVFVDDVLNDGYTYSLTENLFASYGAGTVVDLYGHPLEVSGTYPVREDLPPVADGFLVGLQPKSPVAALSSSNVTLAGEQTIDGVSLIAGDRVLLISQTDARENGIWEVSVFSWTRPSDFEGGSLASKSQVFVTGGSVYASTSWVCTSTFDFSVVSDPFALPTAISGDLLIWAQISTVTTFVVHSEYPIYPGDVINYAFFEYAVAEATHVGTLPDSREIYQLTIDVGIPVTLNNGSTDQVYLRAFPAYESERRPLPTIPLTQSSIGPFLFDRLSGSFFEDLDVEEVDIVSTYSASGQLIDRTQTGKNFLVYNAAIPSDSFLFWDLARGTVNYSKTNRTFLAFTDSAGKFHAHFTCVPELSHVTGFEGWRVQVTPEHDTYMVVQLEPNDVRAPFTTRTPGSSPPPPPPRGGVFLPAGVATSVNIDFPAGSDPVTQIHITFDSGDVANSRVDMKSWEIRGSLTTAYVSHATIAKVSGRNVWASSSAFAKPYWLRLTYLEVQTDLYSRFDGGLLSL